MNTIPIITTPFVQTPEGRWNLVLDKPQQVEWGHRFDAGVGYRVFVKFIGAQATNIMGAHTARVFAKNISAGEAGDDVKALAAGMNLMAEQIDKLNQAWFAAG